MQVDRKILFVGDVCGKPGRLAVEKFLPEAVKLHAPDFVIVNAENATHGDALIDKHWAEWQALDLPIDLLTGGNHSFGQKDHNSLLDANPPVALRPANMPEALPGRGDWLVTKAGKSLLVLNVMGRLFMKQFVEDPFITLTTLVEKWRPQFAEKEDFLGILLDFHAEATSEKEAIFYFAERFPEIVGVLGTHTHVQTADQQIGPTGIGFMSDVGLTGAERSVIGHEVEGVLERLQLQVGKPKVFPEDAGLQFCAAVLTIDQQKCTDIQTIFWRTES